MKKDDEKFRKVVGYNFKLRVLRDRVGLFIISVLVILVAIHFLKTREADVIYFANNKIVSIIILFAGIGGVICSCFGFLWKTNYAKYDRMKQIVGMGEILYENAFFAIVDSVFIDKHNYLNMFYLDEVYKVEADDRRKYNALREEPEIKVYIANEKHILNVSRLSMTSARELADVIEKIAPNIGRKEETLRIARQEANNSANHIIPTIGRIYFDDGDYYKQSNQVKFVVAGIVGLIALFMALVFGGLEIRHSIQYTDFNDKNDLIEKNKYPVKGYIDEIYGEVRVDVDCGSKSSSKVKKYVLPYKDKLILFCDKDGIVEKNKGEKIKFHGCAQELKDKELSDCNEVINTSNIDTKNSNKEIYKYCIMTRETDRNFSLISTIIGVIITVGCVYIMIKNKRESL
ncbi:hypothetical protein [uncultured Eubacterium sp.]|uniref:hypothetical protein n=1 Tax=uncultured Eubacterium sp. TaxID=165185 RepID=UPI0017B221D4|nr:hypothetical protein [uncultured Eubacterium sp.]HII09125.1 hypothetical protein [Methanosphaera sp.]